MSKDNIESELLTREQTSNIAIIDAITGKECEQLSKNWMLENILSIRNVVKLGTHDKVYYPACGIDILRIMAAYDPTEVIGVDPDVSVVPRVIKQFSDAGTTLSESKENETTIILEGEFQGKKRKITFIHKDAREHITSIIQGSVDILHIYRPTGAESEIQKDSGSEVIGTRIKNRLTKQNYELICENGFMVFEEQRLSHHVTELQILLKIAGIVEHRITRRDPRDVMSTKYQTEDEIVQMDRSGFVYQKANKVDLSLIEDVVSSLDERSDTDQVLAELRSGIFSNLIEAQENLDINAALQSFLKAKKRKNSEAVAAMIQHGAAEEDANAYSKSTLDSIMGELQSIQTEFREFLTAFNKVSKKIQQGIITENQAFEELGIVQGQIRRESKKWLIALTYLQGMNKRGINAPQLIKQFTEIDLTSLQNP